MLPWLPELLGKMFRPFQDYGPVFGDKPLRFQVVCPQYGTAVLKGQTPLRNPEIAAKTVVDNFGVINH